MSSSPVRLPTISPRRGKRTHQGAAIGRPDRFSAPLCPRYWRPLIALAVDRGPAPSSLDSVSTLALSVKSRLSASFYRAKAAFRSLVVVSALNVTRTVVALSAFGASATPGSVLGIGDGRADGPAHRTDLWRGLR